MLANGWEFSDVSMDNPVANLNYLYELYLKANANYSGRVTVPVLWDKKTETIVNNESSEIIRMLNTGFNPFTQVKTDFYPPSVQAPIDEINARVYETINNGVYRAGFATTQQAYEKACHKLFATLDDLENTLTQQRYLTGDTVTEADWRLFTTLIRFDSVYYGHFKTNLKRIEEYPNLSNYLRDLYQYPGVAETVNFEHIKTHYYYSHNSINPTRVVPIGPMVDYQRPHNRERNFKEAQA
jgi:putative glutathione S-transferase